MAYSQVNAGVGSSSLDKRRKAKWLNDPEIPQARVINLHNVKFLFDKILTASNVSGHNGIIIPKVHADQFNSEFSEYETTAYIYMDDMNVEKVWRFRLRSMPNGRFRKSVIEGTGKYIAACGAQVGDYVNIYKDHEVQRFAIGWRKQAVKTENPSDEVAAKEAHNNASLKEVKNIVSDEVVIGGIHNNISSKEIERIILLASSCGEAAAHDYCPESAPADETDLSIQPSAMKDESPTKAAANVNNQSTQQSDIIDEEYVRKNFNMSWEEFIEFNPFDFP